MKYKYSTNCTCARGSDIQSMVDSAIIITRETFLKHVDRADLAQFEQSMGYSAHPSQGLTMAGDWHVSYHRGKYRGKRCYYVYHSAIEHIFLAA